MEENGGAAREEAELSRRDLQRRIAEREEDVKLLEAELRDIDAGSDRAAADSERIFGGLAGLVEAGRRHLRRLVASQQEVEVNRVGDLQEELERQTEELKGLQVLAARRQKVETQLGFVQTLQEMPDPELDRLRGRLLAAPPAAQTRRLSYFQNVTETLADTRDQVRQILSGMRPEPTTRSDFLSYRCDLTLDAATANRWLFLSDGNRKATVAREDQRYPSHPDRFMYYWQVLSREALTGRRYWEVEWTGPGVDVALAYGSISRVGSESEFGLNDKSWALYWNGQGYFFVHDQVSTFVPGRWSSRVGVYLDHAAGLLSFYAVSDSMTLLHRVRTDFAEPLHVGLHLHYPPGHAAELVRLA